ncbi:unnamed protein product [Chironomus riparius]|uniref:RRM domain-containing protein n=1 Tax=Chironomus riparius TaxID=315576 RepID=A0A9P0IVS1_9DIPT|nr:unnamed protein product [Chironomus riparius]
MDKTSESENSLYTDIVKNLSSLMSDVKLENDGSSMNDASKCVGTKLDKQPNTSSINHGIQQTSNTKSQLDYQQQNNAYLNQLQILSLQNPQLLSLHLNAHIQQLTAYNQLYLKQNQSQLSNLSCVWSGPISTKTKDDAAYSKKVFLGGIPWKFDNKDINKLLNEFGPIKIEWPVDENNNKVKGFTYVIFESEQDVKALLDTCKKNGTYFYKSSSYFHRMVISGKQKIIEIIPWKVSDACHVNCSNQSLNESLTAFIGGIHGKLSANALATIMNDLFGGVAFVGIDVDEYSYPKGAGRVIFNNQNSYMQAVAAKFIQVKSGKLQKKLQIDPFIQDSLCSSCGFQRGKYFCRDVNCFSYFCCQCWNIRHSLNINFQGHIPLTRSSNSQQHECLDMKFVGTKKDPIKPFVMPTEGNKTKVKNSGKKKSGLARNTAK